jgi:hypothetical protein
LVTGLKVRTPIEWAFDVLAALAPVDIEMTMLNVNRHKIEIQPMRAEQFLAGMSRSRPESSPGRRAIATNGILA